MKATKEAVFDTSIVEAWLRVVPRKEALRFLRSLDEVLSEKAARAEATPICAPEYPDAVKGAQVMLQAVMRAFVRAG